MIEERWPADHCPMCLSLVRPYFVSDVETWDRRDGWYEAYFQCHACGCDWLEISRNIPKRLNAAPSDSVPVACEGTLGMAEIISAQIDVDKVAQAMEAQTEELIGIDGLRRDVIYKNKIAAALRKAGVK